MAASISQNLLLTVPLAPLGRRHRRRLGRQGRRPQGRAHRHHPRRIDLLHLLGHGADAGAGRRPLRRHDLRMGHHRWPAHGGRLPGRWPHRDDDGGRHLRLADGARLHHRLHGRRPGLPALFLVHLAVHLLDVDAGDEQQLPAAVLRLGGGGPGVLPADRLLVQAADGDLRQHEGLPGQPGRRLRLHPGHRPDRGLCRHAGLRAGLRQVG